MNPSKQKKGNNKHQSKNQWNRRKKNYKENQWNQSWYFEKINKMDNKLVKLIRKKEKKAQITPTDILKILKG